jgi:hypothetical protein
MDNLGGRSEISRQNEAIRSQENFNVSNNPEQAMAAPESAIDARANDTAEARKAKAELQQFFAQKAEEKATIKEEVKERIEGSEELAEIPVEREAKAMPKAYYKKTMEMIKKDENDPHELCDDIARARWDFMRKIFNRDLGDGLNGEGKKAA